MRSLLLCLFVCLCFSSLLLSVRGENSEVSSFDISDYDDSEFVIADDEPADEAEAASPASPEEEAEAPPNQAYAELLETDSDFDIQAEGLGAEYLASLSAPPKRRLRTHEKTLPTITQSVRMFEAPASPKLAALPPQKLPREILSKRHAPRLALQRLPIKKSTVSETRKVQVLPPLPPRKRAPQYRTQPIMQEVVQPVVSVQPMLHERVLTRTIMQPTLQKQPVIQPIITQPVLTREIHEQPITQQQMKYRNIVQTREVKQPEIREELKTEESTAPKQTVEAKGAPFTRMTQPPKHH